MKKNESLSAEELFQKAASGQHIILETFIDLKAEKLRLREDIEKQFSSISRFSEHCYMHHSHISDFFNKDKKISRSRMIAMLIVLGYDIRKIKSVLERFQLGTLYIKNKRDYIIIQAVREADLHDLEHRLRLDHVENRLLEQEEQTLIQDKHWKG